MCLNYRALRFMYGLCCIFYFFLFFLFRFIIVNYWLYEGFIWTYLYLIFNLAYIQFASLE